MQSGWLEQFHRRVAGVPKEEPDAPETTAEAPGDVTRRAFIQSGLATGVTAGMAAGGMLAQTQVAQAQMAIARECLKDERVQSADVQVVLNSSTAIMTVSIAIVGAAGPFSLVLSVSAVTVTILSFL